MNFHGTKNLFWMVSHDLWAWNRKIVISMRFEIQGLVNAWFNCRIKFICEQMMYLLQESRFFVQGNVAFIQVSFLSHAINPYKQWTHDISLEQSLYKPCVFYLQKNQRNVWKIDWNTVLIQKSITWTSGCYEKTSCNNFNLLDFMIYFLVITLLELICYFFGGP